MAELKRVTPRSWSDIAAKWCSFKCGKSRHIIISNTERTLHMLVRKISGKHATRSALVEDGIV